MNEPHRSEDSNPFKIVRGVPLWGLLLVVGGIAFTAIATFFQVGHLSTKQDEQKVEQAKQWEVQSKSIAALAADMRAIVTDLTDQKIKNVERDMKIEDARARLVKLEARR